MIAPPLAAFALLLASTSRPQEEEPSAKEPEPVFFDAPSGVLRVALRERTIGYLDPSMAEDSVVHGPGGKSMAYMVSTGSGLAIVHNGKEGESFEALPPSSVAFSPDGSRLAYAGYRDSKQYIVLDGKLNPCGAVTQHGVVFSPDSRRVAWVVEEDSKQIVVIDSIPQTPYDGIDPKGLSFSSNSQHYAFIATSDGKQCLVLDGVEGPFFDSIAGFWFSPDGEHLAYVGRSGGKLLVFFDGEPICEADGMGRGVVFPNHGNRYAVAARVGEEWQVIVDGKSVGGYKNVFALSFSPDGAHFAYGAGRGEGMLLVVDGEEKKDYDAYESLAFAPLGERLAYTARRGSRHVAVVDGKEGPEFDAIGEPGVRFSADGAHFFYVGTRNEQLVVVLDGKEGVPLAKFGGQEPAFDAGGHLVYTTRAQGQEVVVVDLVPGPSFQEVHPPVFSADGSRFGYAGKRGNEWFVMLDGEKAASYPFVPESPVFSSDGKRVAYRAVRNRRSFVVVDGVEGPKYDLIRAGTIAFSPEGRHVAYACATGEHRYLVIDDLVIENGYEGFLEKVPFHFADETHCSIRVGKDGRLVWVALELSEKGS